MPYQEFVQNHRPGRAEFLDLTWLAGPGRPSADAHGRHGRRDLHAVAAMGAIFSNTAKVPRQGPTRGGRQQATWSVSMKTNATASAIVGGMPSRKAMPRSP